MGTKTVLAVAVMLFGLGSAGAAQAWTISGTSSQETWLMGSDGAGSLIMCDTTSNNFITWPGSGGVAPAEPLDQNGSVNMLGSADTFRIVTNDGVYDCGWMGRVNYSTFQMTIRGGDGDDGLIGGIGTDNIFGDSTTDIEACAEDDAGGDDYLGSGGGADFIYGCGGDDIFDTFFAPGSGTQVYGGLGADCIETLSSFVTVWCTADGNDTDGSVDE